MATRRPKVPRADALGSPSSGSRPSSGSGPSGADGKPSEGAEVIKAKFGGERATSKTPTPAVGGKTPAASKASSSSKAPAASKASSASKASNSTEDRELDPVPAKAFSGRMLALAVVMIAITILLAPTVKIFLEKRAEISALEGEIASRKAEQTELNKQLSRWQDPNYVKQQARDRINMVMPGETGYWVFGAEEAAGTPGGRTGSGSSANPENLPWVDALWESIRRSATD
ncbi:FtsB family cell division protein [Paenarthrobacter nitroguajacolicus]|uniref:FtsB family cell division protein n=1 Tax=Paenarthrobacter nitroguajacolicus TaxID=211146 RepID=UPI0040545EB3